MACLRLRTLLVLVLAASAATVEAADDWPAALSRMPLGFIGPELNETNCIAAMLRAFQSNPVVKGVIFLPGATDEFYLVHRAHARLTNASPSLLEAVIALTNQTRIQATFRTPFLLLHTAADHLGPQARIEHQVTAEKLNHRSVPKLLCIDKDWAYLQPLLKWPLKLDVRPWQKSDESYHFYRHNFAAFNLTGWEALQAAALAGKTKITIRRNEVSFELDSTL